MARKRGDVGLRDTDPPTSGLLTPANAPGPAMHKLSITAESEIDTEVVRPLRAAYDQNG